MENTFGFVNLKITIAADKTSDNKPNVNAFHVFRAVNANAKGRRTAVLNLRPRRNGITTFFIKPDRPLSTANGVLISFCKNDRGINSLTWWSSFRADGTFITSSWLLIKSSIVFIVFSIMVRLSGSICLKVSFFRSINYERQYWPVDRNRTLFPQPNHR